MLEVSVGTKDPAQGLFTVQLVSSVNRTIAICGATNTTTTGSGNNGTSTNGNGTVVGTVVGTTPSPTRSVQPVFTGAAAVVEMFVMGAVVPLVVVVGFLVL
jgi:hypothetical protein